MLTIESRPQPTLETERLVLRPFTLDDAPAVHAIVSERDIASTTLHIPHPYPEGLAEEWISSHVENWERRESVTFAGVLRESGVLVAAAGLALKPAHRRAELGYWVAKPMWNQGIATEASRAVIGWGFGRLNLHRVEARHLTRNPSSGAVMRKLGMRHEGRLRHHYYKWGVFEDVEMYSVLKDEFEAGPAGE